MHILFVGSFLWTSGDRRGMPSAYKCLKGFEEAGHKVSAIFPTNDPSLPSELDYEGMRLHLVRIPLIPYESRFSHLVGVHGVRYRFQMLGKFWSGCFYTIFLVRAFLRALRVVLKDGVDLVYGLTPIGAPPACMIARLFRKPLVFRFFGTRLRLSDRRSRRWIGFVPESVGFSLRCDAMVMTNDGAHGDEAALALGVLWEQLFFWINGLDKEAFLTESDTSGVRDELGFTDKDKLVVLVSRLSEEKRPDRAILALPAIVARVKDAKLVMVDRKSVG